MLRQLSMILKFYQVNRPFFSLLLSQNPHHQGLLNTAAIHFCCSKFVLFPYIKPTSPYPTPCASLPKTPLFIRKQNIYSDLTNLDDQQLKAFLLSYQTYKHRVFGCQNPTTTTNPFYSWVIKHNLDAWSIRKIIIDNYVAEEQFETPPLWCQARMGQSRTELPDGRIVLIAGEYEDFYDPDFCIYNDVIVIHPDGNIETYNYPKTTFLPTDFHTSTLVGTGNDEHIIIIGSLGYPGIRQYSHTPVYKLDTQSFKIEQVATRNSIGWIHKHDAVVKDNRLIVTNGKIITDETSPLLDNVNTWALNLTTLIWKRLIHHDRNWQRFYVQRQDARSLSLWYYKQLDEYLQSNTSNKTQKNLDYTKKQIKEYSADVEELTNQLPDLDSYRQLLIPPLEHETYTEVHADSTINSYDHKNDYDHVLFIDDIKVGYKTADDSCIQVIIEGKLSKDKLKLLQQNLQHKLSKIESMACEVVEV